MPDRTAKLATTSKLSELDPADYDAVYFAGGAGAIWDFPDDPDVIAFVRSMWDRGQIVSAVCHGSAALSNIKLADGSYLVAGQQVTGFSNREEKSLEQMFHLPTFVPFYLQDYLVEQDRHERNREEVLLERKLYDKEGQSLCRPRGSRYVRRRRQA